MCSPIYAMYKKRLGICLPRGRSRSIINIHEIVTSRWRIEPCHRRRASGVRVKRDAGHTSLSKTIVGPTLALSSDPYATDAPCVMTRPPETLNPEV